MLKFCIWNVVQRESNYRTREFSCLKQYDECSDEVKNPEKIPNQKGQQKNRNCLTSLLYIILNGNGVVRHRTIISQNNNRIRSPDLFTIAEEF